MNKVKTEVNTLIAPPLKIKKILITQPKPDGDKSPYFELAKKHNVSLDFHPFMLLMVSLLRIFVSKKST